jgi:TPR repeat protein
MKRSGTDSHRGTDGLKTNESNLKATSILQLLADQGNADSQFKYGLLLATGDELLMNKSLAAHSLNYQLIKDILLLNSIMVFCF